MRRKLLLSQSILFFYSSFYSQCRDSLATYSYFRSKWNKNVEIFKAGTWKLAEVDFKTQNRDSFDVVQPIERSGINFISTLTKNGYMNKASILVQKEENLDVEVLVAMLYLIESFNPEFNSNDRQRSLNDWKTEAEAKKGRVSHSVGKNTYYYEPGMIGNVLTVVIGKS